MKAELAPTSPVEPEVASSEDEALLAADSPIAQGRGRQSTGPLGAGTKRTRNQFAVLAARYGTRFFPSFRTLTMPALDEGFGRVVLALTLSVLLWLFVANLENPDRATTFVNVPIQLRGLGPDLRVRNQLPNASVSIQAPASVMAGIHQSDVRLYVDLTGLSDGVHDAPVKAEVQGADRGSLTLEVTPPTIQLQTEYQTARTVAVIARVNGSPAFGYGLEPPQVDPSRVKISGTRDAVDRVASAVVNVDVDEKAGTQHGTISPVALDASGKEISGLTFEPAGIQVVVPIKLLLNYKVVPIRVPVQGQPAAGYRVSAIAVDPTNVTVCCSPTLLNPLQFLDTAPVTINGTTSTVVTSTQLLLPSGVELYPGQSKTVAVTISIEALVTTLQLSVAPTVEGLTPGYGNVISPDRLEITLAGTFTQLQNLKPTDISAYVNLRGLGPGTYDLVPQITVPQGVKIDSLKPARVTVTLLATAPTASVVPAGTVRPSPVLPRPQPTSPPVLVGTTPTP